MTDQICYPDVGATAEIGRDPLPVCLCPWRENPHRLVSLWDIVKAFSPDLLTHILTLVDIDLHARSGIDAVGHKLIMDHPLPADTKELGRVVFSLQREECVALGLTASVATIDRLLSLHSKADATWGQLDFLEKELKSRLNDELKGNFFLSLTTSESERYNRWFEGWQEIIKRFPKSITDIEELNKCFALARYPGAIFHSVQSN